MVLAVGILRHTCGKRQGVTGNESPPYPPLGANLQDQRGWGGVALCIPCARQIEPLHASHPGCPRGEGGLWLLKARPWIPLAGVHMGRGGARQGTQSWYGWTMCPLHALEDGGNREMAVQTLWAKQSRCTIHEGLWFLCVLDALKSQKGL